MNSRKNFGLVFFAIIVCLTILINPGVGVCSSDDIDWTGEYNAEKLPQNSDPMWNIIIDLHSCIHGFTHEEIIPPDIDILTLSRRNGFVYFELEEVLNTPSTLEFRMKVNRNTINITQRSAYVLFAANSPAVLFNLYPGRVRYSYSYNQIVDHFMDTEAFHVYRILLHGGGHYTLYIDGVLINDFYANDYFSNVRFIRFGEEGTYCNDSGGSSESEWDYVRYYNGEAIPPNADEDNDGILDDDDNCISTPNPDQTDSDSDGMGDACDACPSDPVNDADGDGLCESEDNCPAISNSNQFDSDSDGQGDACDTDDDNDGILDVDDNCPLNSNTDQADSDGDGAGDVCDTDDDNDGVLDADDQCLSTPLGDIVDYSGCSIADLCPCENQWKNHGAFVKCVAHYSEEFVSEGLITEFQKDSIVSNAAESECGHKK